MRRALCSPVATCLVIVPALWFAGCGGSSPTPLAPTPPHVSTPPPAPAPTQIRISGRVTATNGGQPLAGLSAAVGATSVTTDGSGSFSASMLPTASISLALTGSSIVPRSLRVAASSTRDVSVDAIVLGGGFDPTFYRQLVRNSFDQPGTLQPLRRWTTTPSVYLKTVDEAGEAIHGPTLNVIETTLKEAVPAWTSGALGTPAVERGTGSREGQSGWITIKFPAVATPGRCGTAQIGADGGWIELEYHAVSGIMCRAPGSVVAPRLVRHEIGHALGFWHTDNPNDVMYGSQYMDWNAQPSARERYHAAISYRRPIGNVDPDTDGAGTVTLAPMTAR